MKLLDNIFSIADEYDTLFVDVYGVLFDGLSMYEGVLDTLKQLKKDGKKIVILSNTTQLTPEAVKGYAERGMLIGTHYDYYITSGEFLRNELIHNKPAMEEQIGRPINAVKFMFIGSKGIFEGTNVKVVDDFQSANAIYVAPPRSSYGAVRIDALLDENDRSVSIEDFLYYDWRKLKDREGRQGLAEFARMLEIAIEHNLPLLIANSDIFAHTSTDDKGAYPTLTQGGIGRYYEVFYRGKALYFGKPHPGIFEFAKQQTASQSDKIVMVGDTLWTDIVGAQQSSIDSAMVTTGITHEVFKNIPNRGIKDKLAVLLEQVGPKLSGIAKKLEKPTYLLKKF